MKGKVYLHKYSYPSPSSRRFTDEEYAAARIWHDEKTRAFLKGEVMHVSAAARGTRIHEWAKTGIVQSKEKN